MKIKWNKKILVPISCLLIFLVYLLRQPGYYITIKFPFLKRMGSIECYRIREQSLEDITNVQIRNKSIFFMDTSCNSYLNGKITITSRQACSVESAARLNPNYDVNLVYTSPGLFNFENSESDRFLRAILSYKNVRLFHLDYQNFTKGTPLEDLYLKCSIENSLYPTVHASDILRMLTLWKYGGIYLDLDVIVIRSLENLQPDFAGGESSKDVANGILGFQSDATGHLLADLIINDLKHSYNGNDWSYNGPGVITRMLAKLCGVTEVTKMTPQKCKGFTIYPPHVFYAVPWRNWTMFMEEKFFNQVEELTKDSYILHFWNKFSAQVKLPVTSEAAYTVYARKYCPKVFKECDTFF